uniref:USP domain-containing protein n=1 Tax=Phytophthora ramorum TaxID=164328 RepID=H3GFG8_PHYRM
MDPRVRRGMDFLQNELDIPLTSASRSCTKYDLYAVVHHSGSGLSSGHYTAHIRRPDETCWWLADDASVSPLSEDEVSPSSTAYLLFYVRQDVASGATELGDLFPPRRTAVKPSDSTSCTLHVHSTDEEDASSSFSEQSRAAGRLSDDVWYFCVARASPTVLEWFTVDAGTESSDEEDVSPSTSSGGAVLLTSTRVSSVEAVDGESVTLPEQRDNADDSGVIINLVVDEHERRRLESCSLYVEDDVSGVALLIETESETHRDQWVHFLNGILHKEDEHEEGGGQVQGNEEQEAGEVAMEDLESLHFSASRSSISTRSLLHQGKSENLLEEDDPFGLLSLTTSALSSVSLVDDQEIITTNTAPGMFAMDHFEIAEGDELAEEIEDTDGSDTSAANMDGDYVADTAVDPSLLRLYCHLQYDSTACRCEYSQQEA